MGNLVEFPTHKTRKKPLSREEYLKQELSVEEAVNELTHCMLTEVIRIYIDNKWSFSDLDYIVAEFRETMEQNAPNNITRHHIEVMNERLKPIWMEIVHSIRSSRI